MTNNARSIDTVAAACKNSMGIILGVSSKATTAGGLKQRVAESHVRAQIVICVLLILLRYDAAASKMRRVKDTVILSKAGYSPIPSLF